MPTEPKYALSKNEVLEALRDDAELPDWTWKLPHKGRTIYEIGFGRRLRSSSHFNIDFASYPGGTTREVPRQVIDKLEREGIIRRSWPDKPQINAWILTEEPNAD